MAMMKIFAIWCLFILVDPLLWVEANVLGNFGEKVKTGVLDDINTITHPVGSAILTTATSNCEIVKRFFHITYEQLDDKREPDVNNLKIYFKTNEGETIYNINDAAKEIPKNPNFHPSYKVAIFLHGFTDNPNKTSFQTVSKSLLEKGGYNILALDASSLIGWLYLRSTTYVRFIGEKFGEVIVELIKGGIKEDDVLIIGHSLGAHIASFAAKKFSNVTSKRIGRVTGLDPAGPCYQNLQDNLRLQKSDAKFVDVIHTNAGVFGTTYSLGQVDYFPNGGSIQPGCLTQQCSHEKVWAFYAAAELKPDLFIAEKCKSWNYFKKNKCDNSDTSYMGYASSPNNIGNYYLVTSGDFPYGLGKEGLNYNGGNGILNKIDNSLSKYFGDDDDDDENDDNEE